MHPFRVSILAGESLDTVSERIEAAGFRVTARFRVMGVMLVEATASAALRAIRGVNAVEKAQS